MGPMPAVVPSRPDCLSIYLLMPIYLSRLNNLQRVFIRGSYAGGGSQQTRLENVNLEFADEGTGDQKFLLYLHFFREGGKGL